MRALRWACVALVACTPLQHPSIVTDRDDASIVPPPPTADAAAAVASSSPDAFLDAKVTAADVGNGKILVKYTRLDGQRGELTVASLPSGLEWNKRALTVSVESFQRPDGATRLTTVMDDKSPVLLVGRGYGGNQRFLGGLSFIAGKALGPAPEPRRQTSEVVLRDKDGHVLATTASNRLVTFGAAPDAWQLVVTSATTGSGDDEAPALSVDFVLVRR